MKKNRSGIIKYFEYNNLILISVGLAALAWVLDSLMDSLIFHERTVIEQIITPDNHEIGVRLLFGSAFILFGIYIQSGITRFKKAEDAHKLAVITAEDEKNKTKAIIEAIGDGIIIQDTDYKIIYQNQIQNEIYGNRVGEYCYKGYEGRDAICEDCPIELSFKDGKVHKAERTVPTEKGILYVELTGSPLRDSTGKIIGGIKVVRDISGLKRIEEKLREGERFMESIFASIQDGIGIIDKNMNIIKVNRTARNWYPHVSTFVGRKCYEAFCGRNDPCVICPSLHTIKTGKSAHEIVPKIGPGGIEIGWLEIYSYPMFDTRTGEMTGAIEYVRDISERKLVEEALQKIHLQKNAILNNIPDLAWLKDREGRFIAANESFAESCGVSSKDLAGKTDLDIWPQELAERYRADDEDVMESGKRKRVEEPMINNEGEKSWIETIKTPIYNDKGEIIGTTGIARDITERKRADIEKDRFLKAFASSTDGITIADENDRFIYVNEAYAGIFGYDQEELIGKTWHKITPPEMIAPTDKGLSDTMRNMNAGTFYGEVPGLRKDGIIVPTEVRGKGIWDENGSYQGHICIVRDITERKRAENAMKKYARELEEANQLKDLFTDIIRHDLLNPVTVIRYLSENLLEDGSLPENKKSVEMIVMNVGKLTEMIQSAATLAKVEAVDKLDFEERNLCEILRKVISEFTPMIRNKGMNVEFFGEEKCIAEVNPYIEEIFSNLLSNAVKYSPENTLITVGINRDSNDWTVSVKDRGNRIPDEYKETIFERFKRIEKGGVKGTGLGLSIVKRIVDIHKGKVWIEDNPEGGNIFLVKIPLTRSE